jgi:flagellin
VQAFDVTDGSELDGLAAAGELQLVDGADAKLADNAFTTTDSRLYGQFSDFSLSNVSYGVSGTVTATINGADYTGTFNHNDTSVTLSNGNTNIRIRTSGLDVTDAGATAATEAQLAADFADTTILRTGAVSGVDFTGTALEGAVGDGTNPLVSTRLAQSGENVNISNFEYVGNSGAANSSVLSVQVNGETFTATSVNDLIDEGAASLLVFENGTGEAVLINITGQDTAITNIRTSSADRENFINALNNGFAQAGGGLTTNVSGDASDTGITMQIDSATSASLYGGQSVDVTTTVNAAAAETAANDALDAALAIQAQIGATQARFNSAADYLTSATTNIDAARADYLDTDITEESTKLATAQVMLQAGVAALAQANQLPGYFLDILNSN